MNFVCFLIGHVWNGCSCRRCATRRDVEHLWKGCVCKLCGTKRDDQHDWQGCKCRGCGRLRDFYEVRRHRGLRPGYRVRYVPAGGIDWTVGYEASMPVYSFDSGRDVSKDEAIFEIIEIVRTSGHGQSEGNYEKAIIELCTLLSYDPAPGQGPDHYDDSLAQKASAALNKMAEENLSLQYRIGLEALKSPWTSIMIWGIERLGNSRRREAIGPLRKVIAEYSSRPGLGLSQAASNALQKLGTE